METPTKIIMHTPKDTDLIASAFGDLPKEDPYENLQKGIENTRQKLEEIKKKKR